MKTYGIRGLLLFAAFFTIASFMSCDDSLEDSIPSDTLSLTEAEQTNLLFMREEEKLARDVYIHFYEKYDIDIFSNISSSEQYHMDAVLVIMEKYGVEDPASNENGVFTNPTIQELYDSLISKGDVSLVEALKAGATIEDVDIRDLRVSIAATSKDDLIKLYEKLECGSTNHLRGFLSQLRSRNETYSPQFISQELYDEILDGEHKHCGS